MSFLVRGQVSAERLAALIAFTKISGENLTGALERYFIRGYTKELACSHFKIIPSNFTRVLKRVDAVARAIHEYNQIS